MTQLRSYTTIEQSKKLAEILPIESADMRYAPFGDTHPWVWHGTFIEKDAVPCWSLAALLDVINKDYYPNLFHDGEAWNLTVTHHDDNTIKYDTCGDNPLDICYRMIVFLHDENLI